MKKIRVTFNAYSWVELPEDIKEKLVTETRQQLYEWLDGDQISEDIYGVVYGRLNIRDDQGCISRKQLRDKCGLTVEYSLSYRQGDGVALYGTIYKDQAPDLPWGDATSVTLTRNDWGIHYTHANCFTVEAYGTDDDGYDTDITGDTLNTLAEALRGICHDVERDGYALIDSMTDEDTAITHLTELGEVFALDGTRAMAVAQ